jgi:DNA polymerase II
MSAIRDMGYTFKNNRLETVANHILGEGKLIHDEEDKLGEIERQFVEEKENLAKYNLQDVELVTRLYEKIGVVEFMASRVCATGVLMSQLEINNSIPENLIIPELHRELFASPGDGEKKSSRNDALRFLSSSAGVHEHVYSFDTPNVLALLAASFRLGPLAAVSVHETSDELPWTGKTNKEKALFARVLDNLFQLREKALEAERPWQARAVDHTFKQLMTTVLESSNRFFSAQFKSAMTLAMNWFLDQLKEVLDQHSCRVIAYNEETLYVAAENDGIVGAELAAIINRGINERIDLSQNQLPCKLSIFAKYHKRMIFVNRNNDKFLRFAYLNDSEEAPLHITGLYNAGPSWAPLSAYFQEELFKQVLGGNDWKAWIRDFVTDFRDGAYRDKIAYLRKAKKSDLLEKKDQPHIQAALKLNRHLNVISYIMTLDDGAVPKEMNPRSPNIDHYIDTQIARVANVILGLEGKSFDDLFRAEQLSLFEF